MSNLDCTVCPSYWFMEWWMGPHYLQWYLLSSRKVEQSWTSIGKHSLGAHFRAMNPKTTSSCPLNTKRKPINLNVLYWEFERLDGTQTVIWLVPRLKGPGWCHVVPCAEVPSGAPHRDTCIKLEFSPHLEKRGVMGKMYHLITTSQRCHNGASMVIKGAYLPPQEPLFSLCHHSRPSLPQNVMVLELAFILLSLLLCVPFPFRSLN